MGNASDDPISVIKSSIPDQDSVTNPLPWIYLGLVIAAGIVAVNIGYAEFLMWLLR